MTTTATTDEFYRRLPRIYKSGDEALGFPLKTWLSTFVDEFDDVVAMSSRSFTDPAAADASWLAWIGALCGYRVNADLPIATTRTRIADPAHLHHGTAGALVQLMVDKYGAISPIVVPHWRGDIWVVAMATSAAETPNTGTYITTWDEFEASFATWADAELAVATWDALATIDRIHLDILAVLEQERPAGVQFFHVWKTDVASGVTVAGVTGLAGPVLVGGSITVP